MNLKKLILSQPRLLAGGAVAALVVGLGFGWLAHAPIDAALTRPSAEAPNLTVDTPAGAAIQQAVLDSPEAPAVGPAPAPITAEVYSASDPFTQPRPRVARQDSTSVSGDEQPAAYDETQAPRDGADDRDQERPLDYPPPPPPPHGYDPDGPS